MTGTELCVTGGPFCSTGQSGHTDSRSSRSCVTSQLRRWGGGGGATARGARAACCIPPLRNNTKNTQTHNTQRNKTQRVHHPVGFNGNPSIQPRTTAEYHCARTQFITIRHNPSTKQWDTGQALYLYVHSTLTVLTRA